jgi:hypothetical protein
MPDKSEMAEPAIILDRLTHPLVGAVVKLAHFDETGC